MRLAVLRRPNAGQLTNSSSTSLLCSKSTDGDILPLDLAQRVASSISKKFRHVESDGMVENLQTSMCQDGVDSIDLGNTSNAKYCSVVELARSQSTLQFLSGVVIAIEGLVGRSREDVDGEGGLSVV